MIRPSRVPVNRTVANVVYSYDYVIKDIIRYRREEKEVGGPARAWALHGSDVQITVAWIAAVAVVAGAFLALVSALIVNAITKRLKERELFQSALAFLDGGTQKRSIGIAIIKKYADDHRLENVAATIFVTQIMHLVDGNQHTEKAERKIEYFNYLIMKSYVRNWWPKLPSGLKDETMKVLPESTGWK
jgi:hypothetical protein